ncbi:MAG: hypothetical protein QOF58_2758 [Pseudonocardiales bacterium]|jgi:hypothetical protein|nr:hypothetical protein [Pseudonocardiales bacterium]
MRGRLTYSNVMATVAVFVVLGGTGYAAFSLPKSSVGTKQLKKNAVTSKKLDNGGVKLRDLSSKTRSSLNDGVYRASMTAVGQLTTGNAVEGGALPGDGAFSLRWGRDVSGCDAVSSLSADAPAGTATTKIAGSGLEVHTYDAAGTPVDLPFSVIVAC